MTAGIEVHTGRRYTDILNRLLSVSEDTLTVYNCSQGSYYLPNIIKSFYAITQEFSDAKTIILETGTTDFTAEEIGAALNQHGFDEAQTGRNIVKTLSFSKRLTMKIKECIPFLSVLKKQWDSLMESSVQDVCIDPQAYRTAMDEALRLIRSEFSGNLIIMYHPPVEIEKDGTMKLMQSQTLGEFAQLCSYNFEFYIIFYY